MVYDCGLYNIENILVSLKFYLDADDWAMFAVTMAVIMKHVVLAEPTLHRQE